jgi:cation transport regulator ChaB
MKKKDVPQDKSGLVDFTREVYYAENDKGEYTTALSSGWEIKSEALNVAWDDIKERVEDAEQKVTAGVASPILFFMELRLMDLGLVASYTGFFKWQIKRHLKPEVFRKLSEKRLKKYAEAFNITIKQLKTMEVDGN